MRRLYNRYNASTAYLTRVLRPFLLLLPFCFVCALNAQQQQNVVVQPDCIATFVLSGVGTQQINNLGAGCINWTVSYSSTGFSGLSLVVQDAPDSAGVPGAWVTFAGTTTGSNPNTSTTSATTTLVGYYPWMRVNVTSATGVGKITGTLYGYKNAAGGGSGGGGGGSTTVTNFTTCQNGTDTIQSAAISISGSGLTQIVAASGAKVITICHLSVLANASTNITIEYGTGSNCGSGTTVVSGAYQAAFGIALDSLNVALPASQALCLNSSASVTAGGLVTFVQQ